MSPRAKKQAPTVLTGVGAWLEDKQVWARLPRGADATELRALGFAMNMKGAWRLNAEAAPRVVAYYLANGAQVTDELRAFADEMASAPHVRVSRGVLHVACDINTPDLTRTVPTAFARVEHGRHYWTVPFMDAQAVANWADAHSLRVDAEVREIADARWVAELDAFTLSRSTETADPPSITGLVTPLMKQQEVAVTVVERFRTVLIADEPGLGKTLESLAALRIAGQEVGRTVVVCPSSLTANWLSETIAHFDFGTFTGHIAEGASPEPISPNVDIVIVGWAVVSAWAETLADWKPEALIIDEGHYGKSGVQRKKTTTKTVKTGENTFGTEAETKLVGGTARATGAQVVARSVTSRKAKDGLVIVLTGTPIVNAPIEMLALLEMMGVDHLFGGPVMFKERYCGPTDTFVGRGRGPKGDGMQRTYEGASNLVELNTRLRASGHYLRRTKEFMVENGTLPPMFVDGVEYYDQSGKREPWTITPNTAAMNEYRRVEQETRAHLADAAREIARRLQVSPDSAKAVDALRKDGAKHLKRIGELRQAAARVKLPTILAKTHELVAAGEKVVIAAHHRDVVDLYASQFSGIRIQGGMSRAEIERDKRLFNESPVEAHPVLVVSIEAGKTGHTLCKQSLTGAGLACAQMILAEQIWVPGDEIQMEGRIWRIGQDRPVTIRNAVLAESIDVPIYWTRERKRLISMAALDPTDGRADREGDTRVMLDLTRQGLQQGLSLASQ